MASVTVARITPADRGEWLDLFLQWQRQLSGSLSAETHERTWQMLCDEGSGLFGLLARREDGASVGFAIASLIPFAWAGGPILYLQDLFVTAAARGQGVGSIMLNAVYALADEKGTPHVFWLVHEEDSELDRFYTRHHAVRTRYVRYMRQDWPWFAPGAH